MHNNGGLAVNGAGVCGERSAAGVTFGIKSVPERMVNGRCGARKSGVVNACGRQQVVENRQKR